MLLVIGAALIYGGNRVNKKKTAYTNIHAWVPSFLHLVSVVYK